jgi:hypothetical protein
MCEHLLTLSEDDLDRLRKEKLNSTLAAHGRKRRVLRAEASARLTGRLSIGRIAGVQFIILRIGFMQIWQV